MTTTPQIRNGRRLGFTLVELMTVVGIIILLVGLLFPAIVGVIRRAEVSRAQGEVETIAGAVRAYFYDTRSLPVPDESHHRNSTWNGRWYHATEHLAPIYAILTNPQHPRNPAGRVYLEMPLNDDGIILDPWGNPYGITMNTTYSGSMTPWETFTSQGGGHHAGRYSVRTPVVVRSSGPNGVSEPYGNPAADDILSFK